MASISLADRAIAVLLLALMVLTALVEWGASALELPRAGVTVALIVLLAIQVRLTRKVFVAVGLALTIWTVAVNPDWSTVALKGLASSAFIGAFFTGLSTLRSVAVTSPAIQASGQFLASQPPGRRYAALSLGGHLFALTLNYGAISLLGAMATTAAGSEPDPVIRGHRMRRMLLAIQRGFISTLPWSPLAFAMAITTAAVPGAAWADAVLPGLVSSAIIFGTGWALDTIFKPRLAVRPARLQVEGSWSVLGPLFLLLAILGVSVSTLHIVTEVRIVGVVLIIVPVLSVGWAVIQRRGASAPELNLRSRARTFVFEELPRYRGEVVLLMMAGYIGTLGAPLLAPLVAGSGFDLGGLPPWLTLVILFWTIPVLGQLGMNPILAVTLIAPLIPAADTMGVSTPAIVTAIVAGWSVSGISSPFTATTLLVGSFGNVSALHVGLRWNGLYVVVVGMALCLWVLVYAFLLSGGAPPA